MQILGRNVRLEAAEQFPENEPGRIACKRAGGETISAEYGRQENDECTAPEHMARRPFRRIKLPQPIAGKKEQAEQRSRRGEAGAESVFSWNYTPPNHARKKRASTVVPNASARRKARESVGSYLLFSMALTVCRVTPQRLAQLFLRKSLFRAERTNLVVHTLNLRISA